MENPYFNLAFNLHVKIHISVLQVIFLKSMNLPISSLLSKNDYNILYYCGDNMEKHRRLYKWNII